VEKLVVRERIIKETICDFCKKGNENLAIGYHCGICGKDICQYHSKFFHINHSWNWGIPQSRWIDVYFCPNHIPKKVDKELLRKVFKNGYYTSYEPIY